MTEDPHALSRFVRAQEGVYETALSELTAGRKTSHWIWFIFPQIHGLGVSAPSRAYAIASASEAIAYLEHPLLGPRLVECTRALLGWKGRPIETILGPVDATKFRSSMTLFSSLPSAPSLFSEALLVFFRGERDSLTLERLS